MFFISRFISLTSRDAEFRNASPPTPPSHILDDTAIARDRTLSRRSSFSSVSSGRCRASPIPRRPPNPLYPDPPASFGLPSKFCSRPWNRPNRNHAGTMLNVCPETSGRTIYICGVCSHTSTHPGENILHAFCSYCSHRHQYVNGTPLEHWKQDQSCGGCEEYVFERVWTCWSCDAVNNGNEKCEKCDWCGWDRDTSSIERWRVLGYVVEGGQKEWMVKWWNRKEERQIVDEAEATAELRAWFGRGSAEGE